MQEHLTTWEPWHCVSTWCADEVLWVARDVVQDEVWYISGPGLGRWTVAGTQPVCPLCGATLLAASDLAGEPVAADHEEWEGPMFDFIRKLAA
jgi:hypothetical protein